MRIGLTVEEIMDRDTEYLADLLDLIWVDGSFGKRPIVDRLCGDTRLTGEPRDSPPAFLAYDLYDLSEFHLFLSDRKGDSVLLTQIPKLGA